jgi:hypothetical protein
MKLFKSHYRLNYKKFAFSYRVVNIWNALSFDILACNLVNSFKHKPVTQFFGRSGVYISL